MNIVDIKGKNIVIIGIGRSGSGAGRLAKYLGANVLISESKENSTLVTLSDKMKSFGIVKKYLIQICG
jgi:S-adenosylhomocysteine hydrolase